MAIEVAGGLLRGFQGVFEGFSEGFWRVFGRFMKASGDQRFWATKEPGA